MSREIKFRFWSGEKMFYGLENVMECLKQQMYFNSGDPRGYDHIGLHGASFMQFTGQRDKDGKDIYEGDIFEFDKNEWGGEDNIHVCSWDEVNAEWGWGGGTTSDMKFRKVIGNIHEHYTLKCN